MTYQYSPLTPKELEHRISLLIDNPLVWLNTPNIEFSGRCPIELIGTPDQKKLEDRLTMVELGMFS